MKNFIMIVLLFIGVNPVFSQKHTSSSQSVKGSWLLEKIELKTKTIYPEKRIEFGENNVLYMMNRPIGTWEFHKNKKTLFLKTGNINGEHNILKLNKDKLIIELDSATTFFRKINLKKVENKNVKSGLLGQWKLKEKIHNKSLFINFKNPTDFILIEKGENSQSATCGEWFFNTEDKTLAMIGFMGYFKGKKHIIKITNAEFELQNNQKKYLFIKLQPKELFENLDFTEEDFFDNKGDFKYESDVQKLPWQDSSILIDYLKTIQFLKYDYYDFINANAYEKTSLLTNIIFSDQTIGLDYIFDGFDKQSVSEDVALRPNFYDKFHSLYPYRGEVFRVTGNEKIEIPAGIFDCTIVEGVSGDKKYKLWLINNKPGVLAQVIEMVPGKFGYYHKFILSEKRKK